MREGLIKLGANISSADPCIFYWKKNGSLFGLLACHVDDTIWGGDEMFKTNMINKLKHTFQFGCEEIETFTYIGLVSIKTII